MAPQPAVSEPVASEAAAVQVAPPQSVVKTPATRGKARKAAKEHEATPRQHDTEEVQKPASNSEPQSDKSSAGTKESPAPAPAPTPAPATEREIRKTSAVQESDADESDDEICGPTTPMRRGWTPAKSAVKPISTTVTRHIPNASRRLMFDPLLATPQTQKVPLRAPATASPQRPMTLARAASKPMVFRPLPTPSELGLGPQSSPSKLVSQIIQESESEDELHGEHHPSSTDDEDDDDDDQLLDAPIDDVKEPAYQDDTSDASDDEASDSDNDLEQDVATLVRPTLPVDLLRSSPAPSLPQTSQHSTVQSPVSEAHSSPALSSPPTVVMHYHEPQSSPTPSTPGSAVHRVAISADTPTQEHAVPSTSLPLHRDDSLSEVDYSDLETPEGPSRMSFNTATARMLQTPRMRGFRESNAALTPTQSTIQADLDIESYAQCIDPALLSTQDEAFDLAHEADLLAAQTSVNESPAFSAGHETLEAHSPRHTSSGDISDCSTGGRGPRFSLLRESILIVPDEYVPSPRTSPQQPFTHRSTPLAQMLPLPELDDSAESLDAFPDMDIDLIEGLIVVPEETEDCMSADKSNEQHHILATPILPRYARPTVTSEARRKSMSAFDPVTPYSLSRRPVTAETAIKPISSEMFAKLWAAKEEKMKSSRRSSIRRPSFGPIASAPTPKSVKIKTPITERSETRSMRVRRTRDSEVPPVPQLSIYVDDHPATPDELFSGAKPRKHTPSSGTIRAATPQSLPKTPMKTPLKAPGATPGAFPMTPHPSQPLRSVTALVEVFTLDGSSASSPFIALLQRLGARTTKVWSERVTHVVYKDGSPATLQKVRLANKDTTEGAKEIFCVNSRWVTDCDREGSLMDERSEEYAVDVDDAGTKSKAAGRLRRRKSMEPASLRNIDGNVVSTDGAGSVVKPRRGSISRKSLARVSLASTFWGTPGMSPIKGGLTPFRSRDDVENEEDGNESFWDGGASDDVGTPVLSEYMNRQQELEMLQRTAPVNRMKKLRLRDASDGRRLTFVNARE